MKLKKLILSSIMVSIGTITSHILYIPIGPSKCFPMQHFINVVSAVILGPAYAVANAFLTSLLRNILGTGSLLAFPGSMIGAFFASVLYKKYEKKSSAVIGEILGTGIIGGIIAFPIAKIIMGKSVGAFFFVIPFLISTVGGSILAYIFLNDKLLIFFKKFSQWFKILITGKILIRLLR